MIKNITQEDFGTLAICAIRYCHGRQTYMPGLVQRIVRSHLTELEDIDLSVLLQDCERMSDFDYGDPMIDKPKWKQWYEDLKKEKERREKKGMIEYTTEETKLIRWKDRRQIEKKVLPEYYKGIRTHKKMFEIRKDEDGIKPGDILVLREWDGEKYTGGKTRREVTAVLRDCPEYGLMPGYVILSLQTPGWDYFYPSACLDAEDDE